MLPAQMKDDLQELSLQGGGAEVTKYDEYLVPYSSHLQSRYAGLQKLKNKVKTFLSFSFMNADSYYY